MHHSIDLTELPAAGPEMAEAISNCVHCGFCLPVCPTYSVLGEEMDSPRGRIFLMKEVLEGSLDQGSVQPYVDRCLGCMACVTACPSGVEYGELLFPFRAEDRSREASNRWQRLRRRLALSVLPFPRRLRLALRLGHWTRFAHRLAPAGLQPLTRMIPERLPSGAPQPVVASPAGRPVARVALLPGCAQSVLAPQIHADTVRILTANGVEVVRPQSDVCCGSLDLHAGEAEAARAHARRLLAALPTDVDAVVTNAAGCGSGIHEYPLLFKGTGDEEAMSDLARRSVDISSFLARLPALTPMRLSRPLRVAYHDACHLQHALKVASEPRNLLAQVENLELVEIGGDGFCCGSAGIYNIDHPETADQLGAAKAAAVADTGAACLATGNIGCLNQLQMHLADRGLDIPVRHTVSVLADALPPSNETT